MIERWSLEQKHTHILTPAWPAPAFVIEFVPLDGATVYVLLGAIGLRVLEVAAPELEEDRHGRG